MRRTPVGDQIVVLAVADGAADHKKHDLWQRVSHAPWLARVINVAKMIKKRLQAGFFETLKDRDGHAVLRIKEAPMESVIPQQRKRVNPSSKPCRTPF